MNFTHQELETIYFKLNNTAPTNEYDWQQIVSIKQKIEDELGWSRIDESVPETPKK